MKKSKLIIAAIFIIVILTGIIITATLGLKYNLNYLNHKQIVISIGQEFNNEDILNLTKEVINNNDIIIQKAGIYEDAVVINLKDIQDEELQNINTKINEKYGVENTIEDVLVMDIPQTSFKDLIKPYITPAIITIIITILYVVIYIAIKNKVNSTKIKIFEAILKLLAIIILAQLLYFALIAITRTDVSYLTIPTSIIVYMMSTILGMNYIEKNFKSNEKKKNK